jgi:ATP-dependent DNA helicase RecQ
MSPTSVDVLKRYWGYDAFRGTQEQAIDCVIAGDDVFVLMATGGGKSLVIQVPPLVLGKPGLVISPLISLMQDQVDSLEKRGVRACLLGSGQLSEQVHIFGKSMQRTHTQKSFHIRSKPMHGPESTNLSI